MMMPLRSNNKLLWIRTNQALGSALTLLMLGFLAYLLLSPWALRPQRDGFLLGFMPLASVCLMLFLSLAMILDRHRHKKAREGSEAKIAVTGTSLAFAFILLVVMALYFVAVLGAGFLLATPIFLFFSSSALGARPWSLVLFFAVFITVLIFLLLTALGTTLPAGVLFE